jgi:hypothetical protein
MMIRTTACVLAAYLAMASASSAATVDFSFEVTGGATLPGLMGPPPVGTPIDVVLTATGTFMPFGTAVYSETGFLTFAVFPGGGFGPSSVTNSFVASFNSGTDTFFGSSVFMFSDPDPTGLQTTSNTMTILGGTGIFSGASGSATGVGTNSPPPPGEASPVFFSGSGQITAPTLTAPVPEPSTWLLLLAGGVAVAAARRRPSTS